MFARRIGNLPQAFSCVPRIAPIMEMDSCWAEVPGLANGKVQFVDVETLVLKVQGAQEPYNRLLSLTIRGAEDGLEGAVNPFSGLRDVWDRDATVISRFISVQYAVIIVMLCAVFLKYGRMEFCRVLLSAVFVDLYGITDRKAVRKMYEPTAIEMEPMIRKFKHFTSCCQCPCYKNVINEISYIWG